MRPVFAERARYLISAVLAILVGVLVSAVLPHSWPVAMRSILAFLGAVVVFLLLSFVGALIRTPARMKGEWRAWHEAQTGPSVCLNLETEAEPTIRAVRCVVTDPEGQQAIGNERLPQIPFRDAFLNYPSNFEPHEPVEGEHLATWSIRETDADEWIGVASAPFTWTDRSSHE
jgi:hypothetical protein